MHAAHLSFRAKARRALQCAAALACLSVSGLLYGQGLSSNVEPTLSPRTVLDWSCVAMQAHQCGYVAKFSDVSGDAVVIVKGPSNWQPGELVLLRRPYVISRLVDEGARHALCLSELIAKPPAKCQYTAYTAEDVKTLLAWEMGRSEVRMRQRSAALCEAITLDKDQCEKSLPAAE